MIALPQQNHQKAPSAPWQERFTALVPAIRKHASYAFRGMKGEAREDAVEEVLANACCAYARLFHLGKADLAYPAVLAGFGVRQFLEGRRVGCRMNSRDVGSRCAQRKKGIVVTTLDRFDKDEGKWLEAVVEDRRTPVPDQAAFRIDFPAWLNSYSDRKRGIALALALGARTKDVAAEFSVSSGRISQMRRQFYEDWQMLHGENAGSESGLHPKISPESALRDRQ